MSLILREECLKAHIKAEDIDKLLESTHQLVKDQLSTLESHELARVLRIWHLHQAGEWDYLYLIQAFYLEEMKLLEKSRKELRQAIRRIYSTHLSEAKAAKAREALK